MIGGRYEALERAVEADDREAVLVALAELTEFEKDILVDCRKCGAAERAPCVGLDDGVVHFCRRLLRLLERIR